MDIIYFISHRMRYDFKLKQWYDYNIEKPDPCIENGNAGFGICRNNKINSIQNLIRNELIENNDKSIYVVFYSSKRWQGRFPKNIGIKKSYTIFDGILNVKKHYKNHIDAKKEITLKNILENDDEYLDRQMNPYLYGEWNNKINGKIMTKEIKEFIGKIGSGQEANVTGKRIEGDINYFLSLFE